MSARPRLPIDVARTHRRVTLALEHAWPNAPACVREELVQDAWVALLLQMGPIEDPGAWMIRTVWRRATDWWRYRGRPERAGEPLTDEIPVESDPSLRLDGESLVRLLDRAPDHHRQVLGHLYLDEGEPEELAERDGVSRDIVYKRHRRALEWVRKAVERGPGQVLTLDRTAIGARRDRLVGQLGRRWRRASSLREHLGCTANELAADLVALRRSGRIEMRGDRRTAEYRLVEGRHG